MDDEIEVKIIRLIVRLSLFSLLCFFLWSYFGKTKKVSPVKNSQSTTQKTSKNVEQIKDSEKTENSEKIENLKQIKKTSSISTKPINLSSKTKDQVNQKQIKRKKETNNSSSEAKINSISLEQKAKSSNNQDTKKALNQGQISEKAFQEQLKKRYMVNALASNYASSLDLTKSQTRTLLRQIVNLNESNLCTAWKIKNNCPSQSSFEEIGYFAINAQLMPCMQKLKNNEQTLNKIYNGSDKISFLLACYLD